MGEETVLGSLLADGAGPGLFAATEVFEIHLLHPMDEETVVIHVKASILGDCHSVDKMGGDIVERDIMALEVDGAVGVFHLLDETFGRSAAP